MTEREAALEAELKEARLKIRLLEGKVDALVRMIYGPRSERIDPNQLFLLEGSAKKPKLPPPLSQPREQERPGLAVRLQAHACRIICRWRKRSWIPRRSGPRRRPGA